jgi:parallel beta-helix repeat protein
MVRNDTTALWEWVRYYLGRRSALLALLLATVGTLTLGLVAGPINLARAVECDISGTITLDRVLGSNAEGCDTYNVTDSLIVDTVATLTIEPATTLRFGIDTTLTVRGALVAQGTASNPITFTGRTGSTPGSWGYIYFAPESTTATYDSNGNYTDGSIIQHAVIEGGGGANVPNNAMLRFDDSMPYLDHVTVQNSAKWGVWAWNLSTDNRVFAVTNSTFRKNNGGFQASGYGEATHFIITGNTFSDTNSQAHLPYGLRLSGLDTLTITGNTFTNNSNGGFYIFSGCDSTVLFSNNEVTFNGGGGKILRRCYADNNVVEFTNNIISNNEDSSGAGVKLDVNGSLTVTGNTFTDNTATSQGGGLDIQAGSGTISNNVIANNTAGSGGGVSIQIDSSDRLALENNTISGNISTNTIGARASAAIYVRSGAPTIRGNIISNNIAERSRNGGILIRKHAHPVITGNDILNNSGDGGIYDIQNDNDSSQPDIDATGNWWGTTDANAIEARIYHNSDDSALGIVQYTPFADGPVGEGPSSPAPPPTDCASQTEIPRAECEALVALYTATNGSTWRNNANWENYRDVCSWAGISCANGHVTKVELANNHLTGTIPAALGDLSALTNLDFQGNNLSGSIPASLGNLSELVGVGMHNNRLNGSLPASLGNLPNLRWLQLENNQLKGSIPATLGNLGALTELRLQGNNLTGSIPPELGNISTLYQLNIADNSLSGPLPTSLNQLSNLQIFRYNNTDICEPLALQSWLASIETTAGTEPCTQSTPTIIINFTTGKAGSVFHVTGSGFVPDARYEVQNNGVTIGTITADSVGNIAFFIITPSTAVEGDYIITIGSVSSGVQQTAPDATYTIDETAPLREAPEGVTAPQITVPADIAPGGGSTNSLEVYLPLVAR